MNKENQTQTTDGTVYIPSRARSLVELTTLAFSLLILLAVIGILTYNYLVRGTNPATLTVEPQYEKVYENSGRYYLPVRVQNEGDLTAEGLSIVLSLSANDEDEPEMNSFRIDFLTGGASQNVVVVFERDPRQGNLDVQFSFLQP